MADEKKNPLGSTGQRVQANVLRLREARGLSKKDLADRTRDLGRPIPPLGISRIEAGTRRVDADDLVALADALNVSPATLLLPATFGDDRIKLTENHEVTSRTAWQWIAGQRPATDWEPGEGVSLAEPGADPAMAREAYEREQEYDRRRSEYMTLALPQGLRRTADHPLVRLTQQLEGFVEDIVGTRGGRDDRAMWARMALRRVDQLRLNLEEVTEVLTHGDGLDELKRQNPGLISHVQVSADGTVTDIPEATSEGRPGEGANTEDQ